VDDEEDPEEFIGSSANPRRLAGGGGGTHFPDYSTCLVKSCLKEASTQCLLHPNVFTFIGHIGVALMIFESGMHFDFEMAKIVGPKACIVAVVGTFFPLVAGCLVTILLCGGTFAQGMAAGTSLAPTSVGIALKLLHEQKVLQSEFGQAIITAAFVDDILSLVLFNVLFSLADGHMTFMTFLPAILGILGMLVIIGLAATYCDIWILRLLELIPPKKDKNAKNSSADEFLFFFMFCLPMKPIVSI